MQDRNQVQDRGVEALNRLLKVAQGNSGQCRYIARFLLSLYNGSRFPFDLTDFRCIDHALFEDCMAVLRMDARVHIQEVHTYFPNGGQVWEDLADRWRVPDIEDLKHVTTDLVKRGGVPYSVKEMVDRLKAALKLPDASECD